ncbi:MAG: ATP-binding protein, partial [Usitatibacteraceae bacterium]
QTLAPRPVDVEKSLRGMTDILKSALGDKVTLEWSVAQSCPPCLVDPMQLDNAILNLCINARDAMPRGGRIRIAVGPITAEEAMAEGASVLAPGEYVFVSVVDNGQGMSPELKARVCEPFFTTKPVGKGSGLGLSIVLGFANQSGGTLKIDSEPGVGTEVRMYFPATYALPQSASPAALLVEHMPVIDAKTETVLVVDDDAELLSFAEDALAKRGYQVLRASCVAEAKLWLADKRHISMLFTDVVLGDGEAGTTIAAEAQKIRPGLPVLYTSGSAFGAKSVADVRPTQFLPKPYEQGDLVLRVETLLLMSRAEFLLAEASRRVH